MLTPDTMKQVMHMGPMGAVECVYKALPVERGISSEVISGEGKGTKQMVYWSASEGKTFIMWSLEPNFDGGVSQAILRILKEKKLAKMMQKALEKSAQLDIDYLEKGA